MSPTYPMNERKQATPKPENPKAGIRCFNILFPFFHTHVYSTGTKYEKGIYTLEKLSKVPSVTHSPCKVR